MLAIAGLSYFWNTYIFYIELFLTIIAIIIVIIGNIWFKVYVGTAVRAANKVLSGKEQKELQEFPIPVVVVGDCGDMIWRKMCIRDSQRIQVLIEDGKRAGVELL